MLKRDTPWMQGGFLKQEDAIAMKLLSKSDSTLKRVILITHDCDLRHEKEVYVEVIVADIIEKTNKSFVGAKNPRCLHLTAKTQENVSLYLDLTVLNKKTVPSENIPENILPDESLSITDDEKRVLKQWLAARYGRPAFPNTFEEYLRKELRGKSIEKLLNKRLEKASEHLICVFFDFGECRGSELPEGTPYDLKIILVYDAIEGGVEARLASEQAAIDIKSDFYEVFGSLEDSTEIALESCEAVADTYFSLHDLRKADLWRAESISLQQDPVEDFIAVGEIPP